MLNLPEHIREPREENSSTQRNNASSQAQTLQIMLEVERAKTIFQELPCSADCEFEDLEEQLDDNQMLKDELVILFSVFLWDIK
jgi:hypothetical protein